MNAGITLKKSWSDDDLTQIEVSVSDGASVFNNSVYVDADYFSDLVAELDQFKTSIHGGLYDIVMGAFGHEYASGGFSARLCFYKPGLLCISTRQQYSFEKFGGREEASEAAMYLTTEPALLDRFIEGLRRIEGGQSNEAVLACT